MIEKRVKRHTNPSSYKKQRKGKSHFIHKKKRETMELSKTL
jgi:hypothetical protein